MHSTVGRIATVILAEIMVLFGRFVSLAVEGQLTSTVRTIEQTREHRHFPHPGRTPFSCPDFLDDLKSFFVYNRLMGAFKDFPLVRAVIDGLVDFIGFYMGLEIHCMPQIIHPVQYLCDHRPIPGVFVSRKRSPWLSAFLQCVIRRAEDFPLCQDMSNPCRTVAPDTEPEDFPHDLGGFFVYDPFLLVFRIFHIAVGRMGTDMLASHSL